MKDGKIPNPNKIHPIVGYNKEIYVKPTIKNKNIIVGDFTYIADTEFESHVTHHYEFNNDKLIIGPGVNINFFPDNVNFNATSLKNEGIIVDKYTLLKKFLANFDYLFKEWEQNGFSSIRMKWLKSSYKLHQTIKVGDIEGIFEDIDNDGTLIVKMANGKYHFVKSGDVF